MGAARCEALLNSHGVARGTALAQQRLCAALLRTAALAGAGHHLEEADRLSWASECLARRAWGLAGSLHVPSAGRQGEDPAYARVGVARLEVPGEGSHDRQAEGYGRAVAGQDVRALEVPREVVLHVGRHAAGP